ncbi:Uncharacterized protein OBRU01_16775 [Operophtera brumata]|uniref:Protein phosphatase 1 regulatory subunit 35 C-terminal domain-containing protein n=1 Tax=Operophtera brumata TaxID=104452 RepID=A0A0L7KX21_OPEBR|nr:Uncharacterized protein OBRU01_16775 [Operophtera brumata]
MNKFGSDPKVKKTLVRNCEKKVKPTGRNQVVHDVGCSSKFVTSQNENELDEPTLCSSEALANYLSDLKLTAPPPSNTEDLSVTKKLNFHYNDRIYRNLIELNANVEDFKKRKDIRPLSATSVKRDLEPNIEDFSEEVADQDSPPNIPAIKPKFKMVKKVENGQLHRLVSAFENL